MATFVVVGFSETTSGGFNFAMARFTPNGQLDDTFGNGGLVTVQPPGIHLRQWWLWCNPTAR
jgi:hypothetical protein